MCPLSKGYLLANYELPINKDLRKELPGRRWGGGRCWGVWQEHHCGGSAAPRSSPCLLCAIPLLLTEQPPLLMLGKSWVPRSVPITRLSVCVAWRDVMLCQVYLANQKAYGGEMVIPVCLVPRLMCGPEFLGSWSCDSQSVLRGRNSWIHMSQCSWCSNKTISG